MESHHSTPSDSAPVYPAPLEPGSHVRVIAPSRNRTIIAANPETVSVAEATLASLELTLSYGANVDATDPYDSSPAALRVADLHDAFADPDVDGILTVIGGFNCNEMLPLIDWDLIANNPKVFCGYSDTTALQNAIQARTGVVTYSGPAWSTFGMKLHNEKTVESFRAAVMSTAPYEVTASDWFTDDAWFLDQDNRSVERTDRWWPLQDGVAEGRIVGGNLGTLALLHGTPNAPSLRDAVLLIEEDEEEHYFAFRRLFHQLFQQPEAETIRGVVIGRFQGESRVTREGLADLVASVPTLAGKPVVANADFGHTNPMVTYPIGGVARVEAGDSVSVRIGQRQ